MAKCIKVVYKYGTLVEIGLYDNSMNMCMFAVKLCVNQSKINGVDYGSLAVRVIKGTKVIAVIKE